MTVFLVEMGFRFVGQAGLELLTSNDRPATACQSAGITGMSHRARPFSGIFIVAVDSYGLMINSENLLNSLNTVFL